MHVYISAYLYSMPTHRLMTEIKNGFDIEVTPHRDLHQPAPSVVHIYGLYINISNCYFFLIIIVKGWCYSINGVECFLVIDK